MRTTPPWKAAANTKKMATLKSGEKRNCAHRVGSGLGVGLGAWGRVSWLARSSYAYAEAQAAADEADLVHGCRLSPVEAHPAQVRHPHRDHR